MEAFESGLAGKDLEYFPKYYRPYGEHSAEVLKRAWPLALLRGQNPVWDDWINALESKHGAEQILFLPLKAKLADMTLVVDKRSAEPLEYLDINPWSAVQREQLKRAESRASAAPEPASPPKADGTDEPSDGGDAMVQENQEDAEH